MPITDYFNKMPDKNDFLPNVMQALTYDGELYGMPFMMWPVYNLYNLDDLYNAGVSAPKD